MKKYLLLLCALCLGLASCMKEDMPQQDGMVTFSAVYDNAPQTKTVLQGLTPYWLPADKISVYDGKNNEFANTSSAVSATTQFAGRLEGKGRKYYLAAYPYNADLTFAFLSKTVYGIRIPVEQAAVEDSYDPSAVAAIAYSEDFNLSFKNMCSLVKFRIISDGVESVTITANAGENLSGKFNATWGNTPKVTVTAGEKAVTLKGEFKKDKTYYISTLPMVLTEGITVVLNETVVTMKETYQIDLARSGMVNLGDLSLDPSQSQKPANPDEGEDDAVPCDWVLIGEHNTWDTTTATPMYEIGNNYVAFDVPAAAAAGFKFKNGETWIGTTAAVALNAWVTAQGEGGQNIVFTAAEGSVYDVYFAKDMKSFYITVAGSPAPEAAPKPFSGLAVAGTFNGWSTTADPAEAEGDYYVLKGINAAKSNAADAGDKGFKFVYTGDNGIQTWYGASGASVAVSTWYTANTDGAAPNIFVSGGSDSALYDVYMTKDMKSFCVVAAGGQVPSVEQGGGAGGTDNPAGGDSDSQVVYLNAGGSGLWDQAGAWFEVWSWADGSEGRWYTMTSAGSGLYQVTIPKANTNIIFVRRGPNMPQGWTEGTNYWNKTDDLAIPSGRNCYTITGWGATEGSWSTK